MNLLNLKYFVDIVTHGSVSAAARVNIVAQQSVSDHLKKLEQFYGTPLFFRTKPLTLTPAGEILFACAQDVLTRLEQAQREIGSLTSGRRAFLGLGLVYNDVPPFLDELLAQMQKTHAEYDVRIYDNCLSGGKVSEEAELVLSSFPPGQNWTGITLLSDRSAVVVRADLMDTVYGASRAAVENAMRENGDLDLLSELPFLHFTPDTPSDLPAGCPTPAGTGELPNVVLRTGNGMLQNSVCRNGQCAAVLPMDYARRAFCDREDMLYFPLAGEQYHHGCNLYYQNDTPLSPPSLAFIELAREHFPG